MASDDADSSRRGAAAPRYRSLRMSATPRRSSRTLGAPSPCAPAPPPSVVPEQRPVEMPAAAVDPMPQTLSSLSPVAPATLTWERACEAPIARAMGNGPMGRMVVGWLRTAAGVDDITIVCFCHGAPFSPVGFLEHAGADELSYPLRQIFVSYSGLGGSGTSGAAGNSGGEGQH